MCGTYVLWLNDCVSKESKKFYSPFENTMKIYIAEPL